MRDDLSIFSLVFLVITPSSTSVENKKMPRVRRRLNEIVKFHKSLF